MLMWRAIGYALRRWASGSTQTVAAYKRTEITVETNRVWIISMAHSRRGWCAECGLETDFVELKKEEAALGEIRRAADAQPVKSRPQHEALQCGPGNGTMHHLQDSDGSPLICLESLRKLL
jgi:hypothetical protein